jgi:ubiquinone/menaquinone biosynthesis C-methylase UbiE
MSATATQPNPALVFETLNRYQHTMALRGAIELELFTHIAAGATTAAAIAQKCNATERGVRILCDFLTVIGFLTKNGSNYGLTPDTALFLDKKSPAYMGGITNFIASDGITGNFRDVAGLVRKGGTLQGAGTMEPEAEVWMDFARAMVPMAAPQAAAIAPMVATPGRPQKVLDIAASHGLYGIAIAKVNPQAHVVAVDWKNVLQVGKENAAKAGIADRYTLLPGSAFDVDYGTGYDVALLTNILHHFSHETNVKLLKKIRAAMSPGGKVVTLEFVPNEDRISPPVPATFSFMMLGGTEAGDAYTFREFDAMFREAGFGASTIQNLEHSPEQLILTSV